MSGYACPVCGKGGGRAGQADFWPFQRRPRLAVAGSKKRLRAATSFMRSLPDFVVIGAAKSGTTSLYEMICRHPRVLPAVRKEINYFDDPRMHERGALWYRQHFPTVFEKRLPRAKLTGEATPSYFPHPAAPARAARAVPRAKLVLALRNPADRAYSHYNMRLRRGRECMTFEDALEYEERRTAWDRERSAADPRHKAYRSYNYGYAEGGRYAEHLERWLAHFAAENILTVEADRMKRDGQAALDEVYSFLGLEPFGAGAPAALNEGSYAPMKEATREKLLDYFRPHNERLYSVIGRRFDWDK